MENPRKIYHDMECSYRNAAPRLMAADAQMLCPAEGENAGPVDTSQFDEDMRHDIERAIQRSSNNRERNRDSQRRRRLRKVSYVTISVQHVTIALHNVTILFFFPFLGWI